MIEIFTILQNLRCSFTGAVTLPTHTVYNIIKQGGKTDSRRRGGYNPFRYIFSQNIL